MNQPNLHRMLKEIQKQTERIPKIFLEPTFKLINELIDCKEILINIPKYNICNHKAILIKNPDRGFTLEIEDILSDMKKSYDLEIVIGENKYLVKGLYLGMKSTKIERKDDSEYFNGKLVFSANILDLKPIIENTESSYCRFAIAIGRSQLHDYLQTSGYRDESYLHTFGAFFFKVDNKEIAIHERKFRDNYYLFIDSLGIIDSEEFSDICHSIMIGYGFISADFHQNESFMLKSSSQDFDSVYALRYLQLRPSIKTHGTCNPIYGNPYGYTRDEALVKTIGGQLSLFDSELFSRLVTKIHLDKDYAILVLLLIEANTSSLILKPAGYSVALEKLTNIIVEENNGLKPIPDKKLSCQFRKELSHVLAKFKSEIEGLGNNDSVTILQKNIDKINNPTNRDKLTKPFEIYGIKLRDDDIFAIDNRNNFLHGRNIKIEEGSDEFVKIWSISMRLNKLINILILKHIGFSGYIINHLKHNEDSLGFEIKESLFEKI